jgi:integrase
VAALRAHRARQAAEKLAWGPAYADSGLVFCKEDGTPIAPEYVSKRFLELSSAAGLPRIVLHGLRHTHATHALAAGVDVAIVSKRLGHSTSAFTIDTYQQLLPEVSREAAELVAAMVRQAGEKSSAGKGP